MQATTAVVVCALACCSLNYFRPHKNKVLFWAGQLSFFITLLVFLFTIILIAGAGMERGSNMFIIGIILIVLNILMILISVFSIVYQTCKIVHHVRQAEKQSQIKIIPFGEDDGVARKKTLKDYTNRIIDSKVPIAQRHMLEYARVTFGAGSDQYRTVAAIISDLDKDRIQHKRIWSEECLKFLKNKMLLLERKPLS